jgi:sterol desaturase/sphingolipid hydroxylase (fatty acid hydroxylase superfamily)
MLQEILLFAMVSLVWLGMAYGIHRLAHWSAPWNLLHRLHAIHHLRHHSNPSRNFGLILTFWDHLFASAC